MRSRESVGEKEREGGTTEKFIELRRISNEKGANRILTTLKSKAKEQKRQLRPLHKTSSSSLLKISFLQVDVSSTNQFPSFVLVPILG